MKKYILLNRVKIQGANAVAGITYGFPAITNFSGYVHNLSRSLSNHDDFNNISLLGCTVISHSHKIHALNGSFTQSRKTRYISASNGELPPIIEEGKMDLTISLLIEYTGDISNNKDKFTDLLYNFCMVNRIAGGSVFEVYNIDLYTIIDDDKNRNIFKRLIRQLLPGVILIDRSIYLENHFNFLKENDINVELFDAFIDFFTLKKKHRPEHNLLDIHFNNIKKTDKKYEKLIDDWVSHFDYSYDDNKIPITVKEYYNTIKDMKMERGLLKQYKDYLTPTNKTASIVEYAKKSYKGYLVPIMVGYKAISDVYENSAVDGTRDATTPVVFTEAVHSVGEWLSVHNIKNEVDLHKTVWYYDYKPNWFLCKQRDDMYDDDDVNLQSFDDWS